MVVQRDSILDTNMLLRLQRLRAFPAIFRNLTGITLALFEQMLPSLCRDGADRRRQRLQRPYRQHAFGGGDDFDLASADPFLLIIYRGRSPQRAGADGGHPTVEGSRLLPRLPERGRWGIGDRASVGIAALHADGLGATPRRKPRGQKRSLADGRSNKALARRRIGVEHGIGRLRRFQALTQTDRHFRRGHTARVRAVAGLVNRMLEDRQAA